MIPVKEIMIRDVITCSTDIPIIDAAKLMKAHQISCLIITKSRFPVGIVTERDMTWRCIASDLKNTQPISKIMTRQIIYSGSEEDVFKLADVMKQQAIKKMPVIDDNKLAGIITQTDIVYHTLRLIHKLGEDFLAGTISKEEYTNQTLDILQKYSKVHGKGDGVIKQWDVKCNDCGHQFTVDERDGKFSLTHCPKCNSDKIYIDSNSHSK